MELFTADGLPVGPAARFAPKPNSAPSLPLSAHDGSQLVSLYRLFLRLHAVGEASGRASGKPTGSGARREASSGNTGGGGGGGNSATGASRAEAALPPGLGLAASLARAMKPEGERSVRALVAAMAPNGAGPAQGLPAALTDQGLQLAGGLGNHSRSLGSRDDLDSAGDGVWFMGSSAGEWATVLSPAAASSGGGSAALLSGALAHPLFLLPSRFFPHVSRLKGFPALAATDDATTAGPRLLEPSLTSGRGAEEEEAGVGEGLVYDRYGCREPYTHTSGDGAQAPSPAPDDVLDAAGDGFSQLPCIVLNTNRSAQLVDEMALRCLLANSFPATATAAAAAANAVPAEGGNVPVTADEVKETTPHDDGDGGEDMCRAASSSSPAAGPAATSTTAAAAMGTASPHLTQSSFYAAQLMVESTARRWFCVPTEGRMAAGTGIAAEYDYAYILFGCGVAEA